MLGGRYELEKTIGEGSFARVKFARCVHDNTPVAVKVISRREVDRAKLGMIVRREIRVMKAVRHPCVIDLKDVLATKEKIYIVMELVTGGELFDIVAARGRLPEQEARAHFQRLIDGVHFCHVRGVYHRDLKPENLLLDQSGCLKISDFGLSALIAPSDSPNAVPSTSSNLLTTTCGTPNYAAPEILRQNQYFGAPADVWSAGVILYVLASGSLPFDEASLPELYGKIVHARYTMPNHFSSGLANLLRKILVTDPRKRATIADIKKDPWFKCDYTPVPPYVDANLQSLRYEDVDDMLAPNDTEVEYVPDCNEQHCDGGNKRNSNVARMLSLNAFELINMSAFDLGNLFEQRADIVHRHTRFMTTEDPDRVVRRIADAAQRRGLKASSWTFKVRMEGQIDDGGYVMAIVELFEILPGVCFAEFRRARGDPREFHQLFRSIQSDLSDLVTKRDEETVQPSHATSVASSSVTAARAAAAATEVNHLPPSSRSERDEEAECEDNLSATLPVTTEGVTVASSADQAGAEDVHVQTSLTAVT